MALALQVLHGVDLVIVPPHQHGGAVEGIGSGEIVLLLPVQHDAHPGQPIEHDEQLHQQRRSPEDPDIEPGYPPQHRHVGKLHQGHGHRDDQRQGEGNGRQGNGHGQPRQQDFGKGVQEQLPQFSRKHWIPLFAQDQPPRTQPARLLNFPVGPMIPETAPFVKNPAGNRAARREPIFPPGGTLFFVIMPRNRPGFPASGCSGPHGRDSARRRGRSPRSPRPAFPGSGSAPGPGRLPAGPGRNTC